MLINAYEQCTRAVAYLRAQEDDLDAYAPSLRPRSRTSRPEVQPAPAPTPPVSDAPNPQNGAPADAE